MTKKSNQPATKAGTSKRSAAQKREIFVEAFFANGENATQAAIAAGFSAKTAGVTGAKMLKDPRILQKVEERRKELIKDMRLDTERLCQEVARLAFSDPRRIMHPDGRMKMPHQLDDDTAAAIASFKFDVDGTIEYKFWDKNSAQERAAKIAGAFDRDHKQKADPLLDLLRSLGGNVVAPVAALNEDEDEE